MACFYSATLAWILSAVDNRRETHITADRASLDADLATPGKHLLWCQAVTARHRAHRCAARQGLADDPLLLFRGP
jgi:hypothetical protein